MDPQRRSALKHSATVAMLLATAGRVPAAHAQGGVAFNRAAFEAKSVADVVKALGASAPAQSKEVTLLAPQLAENGAEVRLTASSTLAGVRRLLILVERNPNTLAAAFDVSEAVEPSFTTNIKLSESSNVYVVAVTADNKASFAQQEVKVTLGGCGN